MTTYRWQKSSYSGDASNCLNIATADSSLLLRESDDPASVLTLSPTKLHALIESLKAGQLTQERLP
ncbi:DUF397 domain-containing protein [Streptomyces sp. NPDC020799]|uniref:DUF397 domain-containing protein n=1 Tax=unclassified Streptomyces TaxID=2593676 RepID=UPI0033EA09F2